MNSFVLALASIALVLVNMGIGWALAKFHTHRHADQRPQAFPEPPSSPVNDNADSAPALTAQTSAPTDEPELDVPDFSMNPAGDFCALATSAGPEYHS